MRPLNRQGTGMFIERSSARIRLARTLFVLLGILPCAGLCGWAAVRHSRFHRESLERQCEQVIGMPLRIGSVEYVRPNAMRLRDCRLSSPSGAVVLAAPTIEVESLASELRVSLGRVDCSPELARVLAGLAREWLRQPARFPVDCVLDVDDFSWRRRQSAATGSGPPSDPASSSSPARPLHVECVAANGSRAIRVRRNAGVGAGDDEVRVVAGRLPGTDDGREAVEPSVRPPTADVGVERVELHGTVVEPLPIAMLEPLAGLEAGLVPLGEDATVTGTIAAVLDAGRSSGSAQGRIERIDLSGADAFAEFPVQFFQRTAVAEEVRQARGFASGGGRAMFEFAEHDGQCIGGNAGMKGGASR